MLIRKVSSFIVFFAYNLITATFNDFCYVKRERDKHCQVFFLEHISGIKYKDWSGIVEIGAKEGIVDFFGILEIFPI
jgi:hypothetical protein